MKKTSTTTRGRTTDVSTLVSQEIRRTRRTWLAALLLAVTGFTTAGSAQGQLFVANWYDSTITAYPRTANGNVTPTQVINTGLNNPHQLAVNAAGNELIVAYYSRSTVAVLDIDTGLLKRTIGGYATGLNSPIGLAVDELHNELIVTNDGNDSITVYDLAASGDAAPLRTIAGASTGLNPVGVAVDLLRDELIVANYNYQVPQLSAISFYPRGATGDVAPTRVIQGSVTGLNLPQGIALDVANDEILVANSFFSQPNKGAILAFDLGLDGNVAPLRTLEGPNTQLCTPIGIALDRLNNELVVANSNYGGGTCTPSIAVYAWPTILAEGAHDLAPVRQLAGSLSQVSYPFSVVVTAGSMPAPPTVSGSNLTGEATTVDGAILAFIATASDADGNALALTCGPVAVSTPMLFPMGTTAFTCISAPDAWGQTGRRDFTVTVVDTTAPTFLGIRDIVVETNGSQDVSWDDVRGLDLGVTVPVTCNPPSGSTFYVGEVRTVTCQAVDWAGNQASVQFTVSLVRNPGTLPSGPCFVVDFREITYFRSQTVLTSSDAGIRAANGLGAAFNPAVWPYPSATKSRGTLFRIYGFRPSEVGESVPNEDQPWVTYPVQWDADVNGYYIDLGGPARVRVCPDQLHDYVLSGRKGNGHNTSSALLPASQRNVPGIMLTHNSQLVKLPNRVKQEMDALGLAHGDRGLIDYVGFQLQGKGNSSYREFVDVEVSFPGDSETDRAAHFELGLHTAVNENFESFVGCSYVDHAPGNDAARLRALWGPNKSLRQGYRPWEACGSREPSVNQKVRANYAVAFNAVQMLSTVNTNTDTVRIFYGTIAPVPERERKRKDHKLNWDAWDDWNK